jgi:hypothetical protein
MLLHFLASMSTRSHLGGAAPAERGRREGGRPGQSPGPTEQEDERGDSGTRYRLDEVAEVDEERFPSSVEGDENQEQLFPIEAEPADRVTPGKVREMWTSP